MLADEWAWWGMGACGFADEGKGKVNGSSSQRLYRSSPPKCTTGSHSWHSAPSERSSYPNEMHPPDIGMWPEIQASPANDKKMIVR